MLREISWGKIHAKRTMCAHQLNCLAKITKIGRNDYRVLDSWRRLTCICNTIHVNLAEAKWRGHFRSTYYWRTHAELDRRRACTAQTPVPSYVILCLHYSVRKTSSSFSSRLRHGSLCSILFTRTQSVKRPMRLGCHENINTQTCSSLPILSLSGVRRL